MGNPRVFSDEELRVFGMRSVDALAEALDRDDIEGAVGFVRRLRREVFSMIRNYTGWEIALTNWIEQRDGTEAALREAMASDMIGTTSFRERAEALMHFTRVHLQTFDLVEDEEKLTFICPLCPSGGRMIADGHYESPRSDYIVPGPHPLTYGRDEIPVYCCHEPVMETTSFEGTGVPMFIVDPAPELGKGPCKTYLYKNPAAIPEHFFTRLGLTKPAEHLRRPKSTEEQ